MALPIAVLAVLVGAVPATAALSASLQNLAMPAAPYSHHPQTTSGRAVLTTSDSSLYEPQTGIGQGIGWHVTVQTSALVYSGPNNGANIPAANLAIVSVEAPVAQTGQPINETNGPMPPASPAGSLDTPRMVLHANSGYGAGTYSQGIALSLIIPAYTRAGTYTATITTTISSGP